MAAVDAIREGFLCPVCMQDLGGVADLQDHFDTDHAQDEPVLNQFREFLGKAKKRFLKEDRDYDVKSISNRSDSSPEFTNFSGGFLYTAAPQKLGQTCNHTDSFKKTRGAHLNHFVVETNKLIIRLTKLVSVDVFKDPLKQKDFEKSVVSWAPDNDINLCLTCGKPFNIGRRRHHCRLCGAIVCHRCLNYLPYSYARKLINPDMAYEGEGFHRASSNSSINTIGLISEPDPKLKTCQECRIFLEKRHHKNEIKNSKPPISVIYEHLKSNIDEVEKHLAEFHEMNDSLRAGDTIYELHDAQVLKLKLMKLCESIDQLSKRVSTLGTDVPDTDMPSQKSLKLQRAIRLNAVNFLQQNMIWLQSLPTEEEIREIKETKRIEALRKVEEERQQALIREKKREDEKRKQINRIEIGNSLIDKPPDNLSRDKKSFSGWKPGESKCDLDSDSDPMLQQISIIKSYIKEAKNAKKFDEMRILQQNLKELQLEYSQQQNALRIEKNKTMYDNQQLQINPARSHETFNVDNGNKKVPSDSNMKSSSKDISVSIVADNYPEENNPFSDDMVSDNKNPFLEQIITDSNNPFEDNFNS